MRPTVELPAAAAPQRVVPAAAIERSARFAHHEALQLVRETAREPRVARHFQRLDPFAGEHRAEDFGRAVLGFALWMAERSRARREESVARLRRALSDVEGEVARYGRFTERYALERFARRAVEALELPEEDRWAAHMLIQHTLAEPLRECVEGALRELAAAPSPAPA